MFLTKRKKIFYIVYKNPDKNTWSRITTGKTELKDAKEFMNEFEKKNQFVNYLIEDISHKRTLSNFVKKILEYAKNNTRESTYENYERALHNFLQFIGDKPLEYLKISDIENFKVKRKDETSVITANNELKIIKSSYRKGVEQGYIDKGLDVAQYVHKFTEPENEPLSMSKSQVQKLLSVIEEPKFRRIVRFALHTGFRRNEILSLEWNDIDFDNKVIKIHNKENFKTKTNKVRGFPLTDALIEILNEKVDDFKREGLVFRNPQNQKYSLQYVSSRFKYYVKKAGLPEIYHFHCCRHTYITDRVNEGTPLAQVQRLAGHSNASTTLRYTHLFVDDLRKYTNQTQY